MPPRRRRGPDVTGRAGRVTIRQVAAEAEVSAATVSRVLAGSAAVSVELAARVREAVRRLGFTPHAVAQSLASGRTRVVGVLVPNLANAYFYALIKRMLADAGRDGYRLIVADSDESVGAEPELWTNLLDRTDGLILCSPRAGTAALRRLAEHGKPLIVLNRHIEELSISEVVVDAYPAMRQLATRIGALGHTHIAYLQGPSRSWQAKERWRAIRGAARQGMTVTAIRSGGTMDDGYRAVPEVLDSRCTAVLAYNDLAAIGLIAGLSERGVRVPEDLSVTGFDDIPFARFVSPPLTTVRSPQEEVGSVGWKTMSGLLEGAEPGSRTMLAAQPVYRASTGPPPKRSR
jgi:DNA-binding LacI/PurR family transcriptional regulator